MDGFTPFNPVAKLYSYYLRRRSREGNVLTRVYLYVCLSVCLFFVCFSNNSKTTERNLLKFGGMIGHDPGRKQLVFGQDLAISVSRRNK